MLHTVNSETKQRSSSGNSARTSANRAERTPLMRRNPLAALHCAYGNQAVLRFLQAAHVNSASDQTSGVLRRKCDCGGSGGDCAEYRKKETDLHRKAASAQPFSGVPQIVHEVLRSPGRPLDAATRNYMEPRFGQDFSGVRIHDDAKAAASAEAVDAVAYTVGRNIVFGRNAYSTGAQSRQLVAHELAHVVQHGNDTKPDQVPDSIASPRSPAEFEAERVGTSIGSGQAVPTQVISRCTLMRLGANPGCSKGEADSIHQGIFDARGWLKTAVPKLESSPLAPATLASLRRNFGPTFGVAANAKLIHDRLIAARNAVGSIPYSCARAPADATCAAGHCGYTPGAGSHQATICADVSLTATTSPIVRAGCVLHESFHATFARMGVDFYSGWHGHSWSTPGYPGTGIDPLLNADSYTSLVMDLS